MSAREPAQSEGRWNLYRLLADAARLRLLALVADTELTVGELAELVDESQPNVSRHVGALRQGGLLLDRRDGTRTYVRLTSAAHKDLVVCDAVAEGRRLCELEGRFERLTDVLGRRQGKSRDAVDGTRPNAAWGLAPELPVYVQALSLVSGERELAIDAQVGSGGMLDVLAPSFRRVVALARSGMEWERASQKVRNRGYANVELLRGELDDRELRSRMGSGANAVFASRLVERAETLRVLLTGLATLLAPGGQLLLIDCEAPHVETLRGEQRDRLLGVSRQALTESLQAAGLVASGGVPVPRAFLGGAFDSRSQGAWHITRAVRQNAPELGRA